MAIEASYGQIRAAVLALHALGNQPLGVDEKGNTAVLVLPFRCALKIKRMLGLLKPLLAQAEELEAGIYERAGLKEGDSIPPAVRKMAGALYQEECEVGSETLSAADLGIGNDDRVPAALALVLADLGPFWTDEGAPA